MKNNIVKKVYSEKTINRINEKIKLLGSKSKLNTYHFLKTKLILSMFIFIICIFINKYGYILSPIITILFNYLYEILYLDNNINKRISVLNKEALFFFEILAITLESGKDIKNALEITCNNVPGVLSLEVSKSLREMRLGKSLNEVLESLKLRIPSSVINNVILNIIEASNYGNDLVTVLYTQIEYLSDKRISDVKTIINVLPMKISVISVLFFIPLILLIILGPIILNFINS